MASEGRCNDVPSTTVTKSIRLEMNNASALEPTREPYAVFYCSSMNQYGPKDPMIADHHGSAVCRAPKRMRLGDGRKFSFAPDAFVVDGSTMPEKEMLLTAADGRTITVLDSIGASHIAVIDDSETLSVAGPAVTTDGETLSLASGGLVIGGSTTSTVSDTSSHTTTSVPYSSAVSVEEFTGSATIGLVGFFDAKCIVLFVICGIALYLNITV
ncbi:MAG: hypothetical protein M1820_001268 [Bogoriella megaspora]|nr:MAG: hypothetical protein M1820_001268 [Bogoriella megaspora]